MRSGWHLAAAMMVVLGLTACAPLPALEPEPVADTRSQRLDREGRDFLARGDADIIAEILQRGFDAEARGDGDALLAQAHALSVMGARPQDGAPDLARQWAVKAKALGATPVTQVAFRGRTLGPGYRSGRISAGGTFRTRQTYNAGQRAEIVVVPVDEAPLSLQVHDDEGAPVCTVSPSVRNLGCRWVPTFTGGNDIQVGNDNPRAVNFYIVLN